MLIVKIKEMDYYKKIKFYDIVLFLFEGYTLMDKYLEGKMKIIYLLVVLSLLFGCSNIKEYEIEKTEEIVIGENPFIINMSSGEEFKIEG